MKTRDIPTLTNPHLLLNNNGYNPPLSARFYLIAFGVKACTAAIRSFRLNRSASVLGYNTTAEHLVSSVLKRRAGKKAIEMVVTERPELILLDVNMPGMSGLEACNKIRMSFDGPIIMVTVRNAERDKIAALDAGADDYVGKPFAIGLLSGSCLPAYATR